MVCGWSGCDSGRWIVGGLKLDRRWKGIYRHLLMCPFDSHVGDTEPNDSWPDSQSLRYQRVLCLGCWSFDVACASPSFSVMVILTDWHCHYCPFVSVRSDEP